MRIEHRARLVNTTMLYVALAAGACKNESPGTIDAPIDAAPTVPTTTLPGTGLPGYTASDCVPATYPDFVDNELGYNRRVRPNDCELMRVNPPAFVWPQPNDRDRTVPWTITLKTAAGVDVFSRTASHPHLRLDAGLPVGSYQWHVSYKNMAGSVVTAMPRRFTIPADAVPFVFPPGSQIATAASTRAHPRIAADGTTMSGLLALVRNSDFKSNYMYNANFVKGRFVLEEPPLPPEQDATTDIKSQSLKQAMYVEWISFVATMEQDTAIRAAAVKYLLALAAWSPTGKSSEINPLDDDQPNRAIYLGLAKGFDLLKNELTPAQRQLVLGSIATRIGQARLKFAEFDLHPYRSHTGTSLNFTLQALMHVAGEPEFPAATGWLAEAWDLYAITFNQWGNSDGGFGNGPGYAWHELEDSFLSTFVTARIMAQVDLSAHPYVQHFGDFLAAVTPRGAVRRSAYGDDLEIDHFYESDASRHFRMYAALTQRPSDSWYAQLANLNQDLPMLNYAMLGLRLPAVTPVAPTALSYVSGDAGIAVLFSSADPASRSALYFRSSQFGSYNHSHADQNSIYLDVDGKPLLITGGYMTDYFAAHHLAVQRNTRYQNAMTFDGGVGQGQWSESNDSAVEPTGLSLPRESRDFTGELINFKDFGAWAVVTGDATRAYRMERGNTQTQVPLLSSAIRTAAYHRDLRVIVLYDWATSSKPRTWELNFQTLFPFTMAGTSVRADNDGAAACIDVYGLPNQTFSQTSEFSVAPASTSRFPTPNQAHGRFAAGLPTNELVAVTVIRENCAAHNVTVDFAGTQATVRVDNQAPAVFDKKTVTMAN